MTDPPTLHKTTKSLREQSSDGQRLALFPSCLHARIRSGCQLFQTPRLATSTLLNQAVVWRAQTAEHTGPSQPKTAAHYTPRKKAAVSIDSCVCYSCALSGPSAATLMHLQTYRVNTSATQSPSSDMEKQALTHSCLLRSSCGSWVSLCGDREKQLSNKYEATGCRESLIWHERLIIVFIRWRILRRDQLQKPRL